MAELMRSVGECLAPLPATPPRRLQVPAGAWDCHFHIIGAPPAYPFTEPRAYTPPEASPTTLLSILDTVGIRYGLAVQPSVHGTDNRRLLGALRDHTARLKGIAVIKADASDEALADLKEAGVVGIRLLDMTGGVGTGDLDRLARRCQELGWHIQICVHADRYAELLQQLLKLPVPFVMDHMGWFSPASTESGQGFQAVLRLLREADCGVKMSGPFRVSAGGPPYADTVPFARQLLELAPDRIVWGSDWPHVAITDPSKLPRYGELLDFVADVTSDAGLQRRILVDNPAALYGLPGQER